MSFDPTQHKTQPTRPIDGFRTREIIRASSRTMTSCVFAAFQAASGDYHPLHCYAAYLERLGHPGLFAHGYMTLIQGAIVATPLAHQTGEALIDFIDQSCRFLGPVYEGDTPYPGLRSRHRNVRPRPESCV